MKREFNLSLRPEPFWLLEAFACMNYVPALDSEEWLNKNNGWSRRQKEEFLPLAFSLKYVSGFQKQIKR